MYYKISIIVPIYNQEKYLNKSIESILNQTIGFENIELILVDDKSTDNSRNIINEYAKKYKNIIPLFLNENSGTAATPKNKGIEKSTASYIMFFDPDDYLLDNICEKLYNEIINEKCDLVSGNAIFMINTVPYYDIKYTIPKEIIYPDNNYQNYKNFRCWGTLYDKKFIKKHNIQFINVKTNEDTYFVHKSFFNAKKISYLNDLYGLIYFIRNEKTLSKSFSKEILLSTIDAFTQIRKLLINLNVTFDDDPFLVNIILRLFEKWDITKKDEKQIYSEMLKYKKDKKLPKTISFHIRFGELLLEKKYFILLHYYRNIMHLILSNKYIQNRINNEYRTPVQPNDEIYRVISQLKDY